MERLPLETFNPPKPPNFEAEQITRIRLLRALYHDNPEKQARTQAGKASGEFMLSWPVLTVAEANAINKFFEAHDGFEVFEYTLPLEPRARRFICRD